MRLIVRTMPVDLPDGPLAVGPSTDGPRAVMVRAGEGIAASGVAIRIEVGRGGSRGADAWDRFAGIAAQADVQDEVGVPGSGLVAIGSLTFDPNEAGSHLVVPRTVLGRHGGVAWRTDIALDGSAAPDPSDGARTGIPASGPTTGASDRARFGGSTIPDAEWLDRVAGALERIDAGAVEKVVLARDQFVWSRSAFDMDALLARLATAFAGCHVFAVEGLVGASPELLLRRRGDTIMSRVLAGTTDRGATQAEDADLGADLLRSPKDLHEHAVAVRSVREPLERLGADLLTSEAPTLLRLPNVQHLATDVSGTLPDAPPALELLDALHPTAAVGGSPRPAALRIIRDLEGMSRDRYAGPVGWCDARGDGEWAIALRCALIDGPRARLFAGAGVVAGSLPELELRETTLKLRAMRSVLDEQVRAADTTAMT